MKKLKLFDIIIVLAVIAASAAFLLSSRDTENGKYVSVAARGADFVFSLSEDGEHKLESNGHSLVLVIEKGEAYVKDADCPDKYCESKGKISKTGEYIVCAPAGIFIKITGEGAQNGEYDAIVG